jgi:hypothetical protein
MYFLEYYLWIAPNVLLVIVIIRMFVSKMGQQFPLFLVWAILNFIRSISLLIANLAFRLPVEKYRLAVAYSLGIIVILRFGVVYELVKHRLASSRHPNLQSFFKWIAALLIIAGAAASATQIRSGAEKAQNMFLSVELLWSFLMCGSVLALFVFSRRQYWSTYGAGIALGFGIFAAVNLTTSGFRSEFGDKGNLAINLIQMAAYHVCVLVWLIYLWLPEQKSPLSEAGLQKADLEAWNEQLQKIVR